MPTMTRPTKHEQEHAAEREAITATIAKLRAMCSDIDDVIDGLGPIKADRADAAHTELRHAESHIGHAIRRLQGRAE
jgi:hypothetical protein